MVEEIKRVSKQHPELFHYTTVAAFKSIYESRQFWATHYEHLDDSSEFGRFRLNVTEFIKPIIRSSIQCVHEPMSRGASTKP
jgi:hypothetical protein